MRRIVILSAFLTPLRSGAEACAEEVPARLKGEYDFVIVTARMRRDLPGHDKLPGGIPVVRLGLGYSFDKWLYPFLAPFEARRYKPQIVHAVLETFAGLALLICQWIVPKAKRVLTLQTTNRSFLKGLIVRSPDRVTAISSVLVSIARQLGRDDVEKIPNGIDLRAIRDATEFNQRVPGRILFVGRLEPMKGVDTLLTAFAQVSSLKSQVSSPHLRIVGDGSERQLLERLASELGIVDRVTFAGYVRAPILYDEFAQAEIFCSLSRSEALGNVFLEARAARCAVLGTNIGGIPDIITHEETGLLIEPDDVGAAVESLKQLLLDEGLRRVLSENGQRNAEKYDWGEIAKRYGAVYQEML